MFVASYILAVFQLFLDIFSVVMHHLVVCFRVSVTQKSLSFLRSVELKSRTSFSVSMPQFWLRYFFHYWEESSLSSPTDWLVTQESNIFYDQ